MHMKFLFQSFFLILGTLINLSAQAQMTALPQWVPPKPIYDINFITNKSIPATLTFSRTSSATYYNSAGTLTTAASGVARFDYDPSSLSYRGLLMEPSVTNYLSYSENLSGTNWYNQQTTLTANATTAPDGTNTASKLAEASGAGANQHDSGYTDWSSPTNTTLTSSLYLKAGSVNQVELFNNTRTCVWSSFVITLQGAGTMTTTGATNGLGTATNYGIQYVGNGWYRAFITMPTTASNSCGYTFLNRIYKNGSSWYDAGTGGDYVYLWGAQMENSSVPTSYIKTTGTAVTRAADQLTMNSTSQFNPKIGTLFAQFINGGIESSSSYRAFGFFGSNSAGTFSQNEISIADQGTSTTSTINKSGTAQFSPSGTLYNPGYVNYAALGYTTGSYAYSVNGSAAVTVNTGSLPTASPVYAYIGSQPDGNMRTRWIQRVQYYDQRYNNYSLANLSKTDCAHGTQAFTATGADQTFTLPTGCTKFFVQAWGAGGGGTNEQDGNGRSGGAGGYTSAFVSGTGSFNIVVGSGGVVGSTASVYGGGAGAGGASGGAGGGRSAVQSSGADIVTAGGGGGSGYGGTTGYSGTNEDGGSGGGLIGLGIGGTQSGGGGTQSSGGSHGGSGGTSGSQYAGGAGASTWSGGGGGGWYGGGGGGAAWGDGGSGGGGSSYYLGTGVTLGTTLAAPTGSANPVVQDLGYTSGVGVGGTSVYHGSGTSGGGGLVIVSY